jgi:hypothetical protein
MIIGRSRQVRMPGSAGPHDDTGRPGAGQARWTSTGMPTMKAMLL